MNNIIERAVMLCPDGGVVDTELLPHELKSKSGEFEKCNADSTLKDTLEQCERQTILMALKELGGKKTEAAERLGISRKTLWEKIKKFQIIQNKFD